MRKNSFFSRTEESMRESTACPQWLEQSAEIQAVKEAAGTMTTAVDVARKRNEASTFDLMNPLVSGNKGRKFSSVDEVVADYQERTGLDQFINQRKAAELKDVAEKIIANASVEEDVIVISAQDWNYAEDEDEDEEETKEVDLPDSINMSEFDRLLDKFNKAQEEYNKNMNAVEGFIEKHTPIFGKVQKQLDKLKGKEKKEEKKRKKKAEDSKKKSL